MDPNRIQTLAGIESDDDDAFMAAIDREKKIDKLIRHAFEKIGLQINYNNHSVLYDDETREATVSLEDDRIPMQQLRRLSETGLAAEYDIIFHGAGLGVEFKVSAELDNAEVA